MNFGQSIQTGFRRVPGAAASLALGALFVFASQHRQFARAMTKASLHFFDNEVLQATTMILFPIFPLVVTTDEIRYHTSENHEERAMLEAVSDDAAAFIAGQEKSALLSLMMDRARKDLAKDQSVTDQEIAFRLIEKVQQWEAKK